MSLCVNCDETEWLFRGKLQSLCWIAPSSIFKSMNAHMFLSCQVFATVGTPTRPECSIKLSAAFLPLCYFLFMSESLLFEFYCDCVSLYWGQLHQLFIGEFKLVLVSNSNNRIGDTRWTKQQSNVTVTETIRLDWREKDIKYGWNIWPETW